eukprot:1152323-Pelagomonas_calceolata.AAC.1
MATDSSKGRAKRYTTTMTPEQAGSTVEDLTASGAATVVQVPQTFLPDLPKAHQEMGDFDDPMNEWAWGRRGEIFEYNLLGSHSTQSGTCDSDLYRRALPEEHLKSELNRQAAIGVAKRLLIWSQRGCYQAAWSAGFWDALPHGQVMEDSWRDSCAAATLTDAHIGLQRVPTHVCNFELP